MNEEQIIALCRARQGHSLLLTGQAGTGKTCACREMIKQLKEDGKKVLVCAATGIACMNLPDAQTVHSVFGLRDGRFDAGQLRKLYADAQDPYYASRRSRIADADVLIIDEIR